MRRSWEYIDTYSFSGVDLNTNPHTFNNLEGDKYDYKIYLVVDGVGSDVSAILYFNGDTGTNYRSYHMQGAGAVASASVNDALAGVFPLFIGSGMTNYRAMASIDILGSSGEERILPILMASTSGSTTYIQDKNAFWKNTADELTSIMLSADVTTAVTGEIYLFRRQKESVYNAADWELIEEQTFATTDINASPVLFENLQGDVDIEYMIEYDIIDGTGAEILEGIINGDTGSNYLFENLENTAGTLSATTGTTTNFLNADFNTTTPTQGRILIKATSGVNRSIFFLSGGNQAEQQIAQGVWWGNSADEIKSMSFTTATGSNATGAIRIYRRSKKRSTSSHERLIYDYDISGDFSGGNTFQNIDTNKMYRISITALADSVASSISLRFNGDTGTNYHYQFLQGNISSTSAGVSTTSTSIPGAVIDTVYPGVLDFLIFPKSGKYRPVINTRMEFSTTTWILLFAQWWANTADDIKDILVFGGNSNAMTGNIKIWEIDPQA